MSIKIKIWIYTYVHFEMRLYYINRMCILFTFLITLFLTSHAKCHCLRKMHGLRLADPSRHPSYGSIVSRVTQNPTRSYTLQSRRFRSCVLSDFGFLVPGLLVTDTSPGLYASRHSPVEIVFCRFSPSAVCRQYKLLLYVCMIIPDVCLVSSSGLFYCYHEHPWLWLENLEPPGNRLRIENKTWQKSQQGLQINKLFYIKVD